MYSICSPSVKINYKDVIQPEQFVMNANKSIIKRVIGYYNIASGQIVIDVNDHEQIEYISIPDAINRESKGEIVELHFSDTPQDKELLQADYERANLIIENDNEPDDWHGKYQRKHRIPVSDKTTPAWYPASSYRPVGMWINLNKNEQSK